MIHNRQFYDSQPSTIVIHNSPLLACSAVVEAPSDPDGHPSQLKRSPHGSWAHLSYGVRSTPGDSTSAETGIVLMRWRGAGDVAASQGLADGQAIAAKHR
jgi:hypothetical protein